jgi:hypothetical protein
MAAGTGKMASNAPIRINPPAIPKRPDRNDVAVTIRAMATASQRVTEHLLA